MRATTLLLTMMLSGMLTLTGCAPNPVSGKNQLSLMSESQEIQSGRQAHQQILKNNKPYQDARLQAYVSRIGKMMAAHSHRPNLPYTFTVLEDNSVNAFALPGGYIYITTGLMAYLNSEAELAAVLGHEIGHVAARHNVSQASANMVGELLGAVVARHQPGYANTFSSTSKLLQLSYGRGHELEADGLGSEYLARAGYDPAHMATVIITLQAYDQFHGGQSAPYRDLLSTHPSNDQRLQQLIGQARRFGNGKRNPGHLTYLKQIEGLRLRLTNNKTAQVRLLTARAGDTYSSLARSSILKRNAAAHLRLLNAAFSGEEPKPGQVLKTIQ